MPTLPPPLSILQNPGKAKAFGALPALTALTLISSAFYNSSAVAVADEATLRIKNGTTDEQTNTFEIWFTVLYARMTFLLL